MSTARIAFTASATPDAQAALIALRARYGEAGADADVIIALGGDGHMLQTLHEHMAYERPIYGMNCGSVGFLMNDYAIDGLPDRLAQAETARIHPLRMVARCADGSTANALAINEVSLLRETRQTAKLRVDVDDRVRMKELICDGILVSTPAGSTAYNLSAHGPILPIDAKLLALTPISAFRPRRWRGALLHHDAVVRIQILEPDKRPVSATADHQEFRNVRDVVVQEDPAITIRMLFDRGHGLQERILNEQFVY